MTITSVSYLVTYLVAVALNLALACYIFRARSLPLRVTPLSGGLVLCGALVAGIARPEPAVAEVALALVVAAVVVAAMTDACSGLVLDGTTISGTLALLVVADMQGSFVGALLGAVCSGGALLLLRVATGGRGLGLGDVKLAVVIGAGLGTVAALEALGAAFVSGAIMGVGALLVRRVRFGEPVAFAPHLATGTLLALVWSAYRG